ncbi:MAG: hypothetical protein ICV60_13765 [Pyrinomonadaceae bacterium]|nr:hypothetical protein [Pyrinomonadaceae bacterium]
MREEAINTYHRLLSEDDSLSREFFARLKTEMHAARLSYGERPIGVSLRPHFLTLRQYERLTRFSETLAAAFEKIAAALVANPLLMERVGLRESERRFALVEPGFPFAGITTRLDAFVHDDEIKFVEYNAENPSSLPDQPGLNRILFNVGALRTLSEHYNLMQFNPVEALCRALLETYREWGGTQAPNVAILDWAGLPTENEFLLLRDYFIERGIPTIIATPDELEYDGRRLRRAEFRIDLVYKRVVIHELLGRADETHPLIRAYLDRAVCLVNPFRCKIMHKKAAFELLTDEACADWFSAAEREVINESVPWTRRVSERKTVHRGNTVDLLEHARRNRDAFILKPNDDYGGRGIFFGRSCGEREWDEALSLALSDGDYIIQEALRLRTELFPVFDDERWSLEPMYVDTNPFLFRGRVEGAFVRLSDSPIVNVTSGGGETGFFVIEGRR